jgi:hypothetical protein
LKFDSYLQALLQGVGIGLNRIGEIKSKLAALNERTKKIPDLELIHGKDSVSILQAILCCDGFTKDAVESSFWTSLEHRFIAGFPNLMTALSYLRRRRR